MAEGTRVDLATVDAAMADGRWQAAMETLVAASTERDLTEDELDRLGAAAYGAGALEAALTAWEQLHARRVAGGDHLGAADAGARVAMYVMMDTGLMAPVRGWIGRVERLLEGAGETHVHAMLAMITTYERFMSGDHAAARGWADRAIALGVRHAVAPAAALGRVARARLLIFDGHVDEGLRLLDEAAVAVVSGELDPLSTGMVYCELICAMQSLAQYDRAEEWTQAMEAWRHGQAFGAINGRCRVHRAEILRLRGSCQDAEEEALQACAELRPWMRREFGWPLTELGTIRLRRGDLVGAEAAFLEAHEHGWNPQPGLALLRLAQGRVPEAVALVADALSHPVSVPSKERPPNLRLCRAPLLEAQVEIALAGGDHRMAATAATELDELAATFRSRALTAGAALAWGRVSLSRGDHEDATAGCETAVAIWSELRAPYETGRARMVLAAAHRGSGNVDAARLELGAARSTFARIGADRQEEVAASALAALDQPGDADALATGVDPPGRGTSTRDRPSPSDEYVFRCDGDTRRVSFAGRSVLLRDLKGMRYLERLLSAPGRELHALDLVGVEDGRTARPGRVAGVELTVDPDLVVRRGGDAGPVLDSQARDAYRRRLADIEDDIDEATRNGDMERVALAEADRDYLIRELSRAFGISGRERRASADTERARASVTRALRYTMDRIAEHHPPLAEHLEATVRTGTYCAYEPDPRVPVAWQV